MIAVGLCPDLASAFRFWCDLRDLPSVDLGFLVSRARPTSGLGFALGRARELVGLTFRHRLRFIRFLLGSALRVSLLDLNHPRNVEWVRNRSADVGLHGMNLIYRREIITAFKYGILNPHIGLLPKYRGRSVMEWSVLQGDPTGVTTFLIDEGIDTGERIVLWEEVSVSRFEDSLTAKDHLFSLDTDMFRKALAKLAGSHEPFLRNEVGLGKRFFVMSGLLRGVVDRILEERSLAVH